MRYTGPKNRIARREGVDLGLKTPGTKSHNRLLKKLNIIPGQHGVKGKRKLSERGIQLREKQKLRFIFGITEKQLKRYFKLSSEKKGNTSLYLAMFLEKRLDNVVYRLGFAPTRAAARQLVSHGNILVNNKKVKIPSYQVKLNDTITFADEKVVKISYIEKAINDKDIIIPSWMERRNLIGKIIAEPNQDDIAKQCNLRLIIEYYSR